jgi:hypothetical protein
VHHTLNASVPQHLYGFVQTDILRGLDASWDFEPCVIIGVTSIPSRCLHFSILCESGAQWARIPIHKLRWAKQHSSLDVEASIKVLHDVHTFITHPITDLQCWDSHGWDFSTVQYEYLREMGCEYRPPSGALVPASYWFTLDHTDNGFSQYPPEHKCYHLLLLEDGSGQIAAMPNNRILWKDDSFVKRNLETLKTYKVMHPQTWHAESGRHNPQDTAITRES